MMNEIAYLVLAPSTRFCRCFAPFRVRFDDMFCGKCLGIELGSLNSLQNFTIFAFSFQANRHCIILCLYFANFLRTIYVILYQS